MWRTTIKTVAAHWRRLLLTGGAVLLGIAFVTGALVLTDTSSRVFDDQFADANAGIDLVVRSRAAFGAAMGVEVERDPLTAATLDEVRRTPGVRDATGKVGGSALVIVDGTPTVPDGPSLGLAWTPAPFNPFTLRAGRAPAADGEVVSTRRPPPPGASRSASGSRSRSRTASDRSPSSGWPGSVVATGSRAPRRPCSPPPPRNGCSTWTAGSPRSRS